MHTCTNLSHLYSDICNLERTLQQMTYCSRLLYIFSFNFLCSYIFVFKFSLMAWILKEQWLSFIVSTYMVYLGRPAQTQTLFAVVIDSKIFPWIWYYCILCYSSCESAFYSTAAFLNLKQHMTIKYFRWKRLGISHFWVWWNLKSSSNHVLNSYFHIL